MSFREIVFIRTLSGTLAGTLAVSTHDGLPVLHVTHHVPGDKQKHDAYRPWSFPAAWIVTPTCCGPLYGAWKLTWNLIEELRMAQREAEEEEKQEPDPMDCGKAGMEARGER